MAFPAFIKKIVEIASNDDATSKIPMAFGKGVAGKSKGFNPDKRIKSDVQNIEKTDKLSSKPDSVDRKPYNPDKRIKTDTVDASADKKQGFNPDKRINPESSSVKNKVTEVNGFKYVEDKMGRTISAEGKLKLEPDTVRNKAKQREAGGKDRLKTDDGGHPIGRQFGGVGEQNLVAQDRILNRGPYKSLEQKWANALKNGDQVYVKVELKYPGKSLRPESFKVNYSINDEKFKKVFSNKPNAYAK